MNHRRGISMAHIWGGKQMKFSKKSKNESSILDNET